MPLFSKKCVLQSSLILGAGALFGIICIGFFLSNQAIPLPLLALTFMALSMIGALIALLLNRLTQPLTASYSKRQNIMWLSISMLAGIFLTLAIPVPQVISRPEHTLIIISTGKQNELARSSEVWLANISTGLRMYTSDLNSICKGEWESEGGMLFSRQNQPDRIKCSIQTTQDIYVRFITNQNSGIVRLKFDQQAVIREDLYTPNDGIREYFFEVHPGKRATLALLLFGLASGIWIGLLIFVASVHLTSRRDPIIKEVNSKTINKWYLYALPIALVWFIYLFSFWPAIMTPDSVDQWGQIVTGNYNDWHPVFHTLTMWLITRLWLNPSLVALAQILTLASLIGMILSKTQSWGTPAWLNWTAVILIAISPAYGLFVITLWKDIPYSIAVLAFTFILLLLIEKNGKWIQKPAAWIAFGGVGALVALFRHNGYPVTLGTLSVLLFVYRQNWKYLAAALVLAIGLWFGVRGPLYQSINVKKDTSPPGISIASLPIIARHIQSLTPFTPNESQFLVRVRPGNTVWPYYCYNNDALLYDGKTRMDVVWGNPAVLTRLVLQLSLRAPQPTIQYLICNATMIWRISQPPDNPPFEYVGTTIYKGGERYGIFPDSKWPEMRQFLQRWNKKITKPALDWLFRRSAFWLYLLLFSATIAAIRALNWKYYLILLPVLLNALPVALASLVQSFRYLFPTMLVSMLLSGYLITRQADNASLENSDVNP